MTFRSLLMIVILALTPHLYGCAEMASVGATTSGVVTQDRRTTGTYVEDQNIEAKASKALEARFGDDEKIHINVMSYNRYVLLTGEVPDVRPYYERASVVVAPLRLGGGMRVKVSVALAAGKAVVATPLAAEGLGADHGNQLLLAEESERIADAVVDLLLDPSRRVALATRARAWAVEALAWDAPAAAFERLYQSLVAAGRRSA